MAEKQSKSQKNKKQLLEIEVSNFGPITKGKVCVRPLTIFAGPSNTGKTYLAKLLYSVLKFSTDQPDPPSKELLSNIIKLEEFKQKYFATRGMDEIFTDHRVFHKILNNYVLPSGIKNFFYYFYLHFSEDLAKQVQEQIQRCLSKSTGLSQDGFKIILNNITPFKSTQITTYPYNFKLELDESHPLFRSLWENSAQQVYKDICNDKFTDQFFLKMSKEFKKETQDYNDKDLQNFLERLNKNIIDFCYQYGKSYLLSYDFYNVSHNKAYYFPAARTGLMQSHRIIAANAVQKLASTHKASRLSTGDIVDFLEDLITIDVQKTGHEKILKIIGEIETNILKGQVEVKFDESGYPDFVFKFKKDHTPVDMLRASSMVTELAPIVLFLKYYVKPNDILIIDEPEAHLHPEAQRSIATLLVALIRAGVKVIVTTHSEILLEQISNHCMAEHIPEEKRKEIMKDEYELILSKDELAVYNFQRNQENNEIVIKEVPFDNEGISIEDHNDVSTELYRQIIDIYDESHKDESKTSA